MSPIELPSSMSLRFYPSGFLSKMKARNFLFKSFLPLAGRKL